MYKIGVVGKREKILPYMAAGFRIYDASTPKEAEEKIRDAKKDDCRIIYITDELARELQDDTVIPLPKKNSDHGFERMSRAVARAVGSDVVYREKR